MRSRSNASRLCLVQPVVEDPRFLTKVAVAEDDTASVASSIYHVLKRPVSEELVQIGGHFLRLGRIRYVLYHRVLPHVVEQTGAAELRRSTA